MGTGAGRLARRRVRSVSGPGGHCADSDRPAPGSHAVAGGPVDACELKIHLDFFLHPNGVGPRGLEPVREHWIRIIDNQDAPGYSTAG